MHLELPPWTWTICLDCPVPGNPKIPHRQQKILLEISCVGEAPCFVGTTTWPYPPTTKIQYDFQRTNPRGKRQGLSRAFSRKSLRKKRGLQPPSFIVFGNRNRREIPALGMLKILPCCHYANTLYIIWCKWWLAMTCWAVSLRICNGVRYGRKYFYTSSI